VTTGELHGLKIFWGVVLALIFLRLVWSFAKSVVKAQDIKYNWFGVVLSFLAMGFAIYLVFFVQV
jgi:hypothetical protein